MEVVIFGVLVGIALIFLWLSVIMRNVAIGAVSAVLILIVGGSLLGSGLEVVTGTLSTTSITGTNEVTQFTEVPVYGSFIGLAFMLLAVYMFLSLYWNYKLQRQKKYIDDE